MNLAKIIKAARGDKKADLLLKNGKIINVFSGEIYPNDVAMISLIAIYLLDLLMDIFT
jgi:adenine deaminase